MSIKYVFAGVMALQATQGLAEEVPTGETTSGVYQIIPLPEELPQSGEVLTLENGIYSIETNNPNAPICYLAVARHYRANTRLSPAVVIDMECPSIN